MDLKKLFDEAVKADGPAKREEGAAPAPAPSGNATKRRRMSGRTAIRTSDKA
ncbi:hypothetical protein V5F53_16730 [Xanthobacter sp. V4C-4]|uniref:hypothetical protein n=1 Tax=Xanthobacter cornucopiae TaxID=3119924 RepID=UPI00372B966F